MFSVNSTQIRLFLHILGACVWLGGQIALAGVVPVLRRQASPEVVRAVARQFQRLAWPAFVLLLATGIWNLVEVHVGDQSSDYQVTLMVKLLWVALSGMGAGIHALMTGPSVSRAVSEADAQRRRAISGMTAGLGLLGALAAAFWGVQLHVG